MPNYDWFNNIKDKLLILNLLSISRVIDIMDVYINYPEGFNNINLSETFEKLRKVNELNTDSLKELLSYIDYLEKSSKIVLMEDVLTMVEMLEIAYKSQDKFVLDTINYILVDENVITNEEEITNKLNNYEESDSNSYDLVMVTNKKIKRKIKHERRDNLE